MEFESGVPAIALHNGYGYFVASELVPWGDANMRYTPAQRTQIRKSLVAGTRDEEADKLSLRIGGEQEEATFRAPSDNADYWKPNDLGIVIVSCERGEMRHSPHGIYVYSNDGLEELKVNSDPLYRDQELEELFNAVRHDKPVFHSGAWGMATLEVALAINESSRTHKDIVLSHQVEMEPGYDEEYRVEVLGRELITQ